MGGHGSTTRASLAAGRPARAHGKRPNAILLMPDGSMQDVTYVPGTKTAVFTEAGSPLTLVATVALGASDQRDTRTAVAILARL